MSNLPELQMRPTSSCLHRSGGTPGGAAHPSNGRLGAHLRYANDVEDRNDHAVHSIKRSPTPFRRDCNPVADEEDDEGWRQYHIFGAAHKMPHAVSLLNSNINSNNNNDNKSSNPTSLSPLLFIFIYSRRRDISLAAQTNKQTRNALFVWFPDVVQQ